MNTADFEFLDGMALHLDVTIRKLVIEERELIHKLGEGRVEELKEFWNQGVSRHEEEMSLERTLDHWDRVLIRTWDNLKNRHQSRADVGKTFMRFNSKL
jgi:hypothetical protein